MDDDSTGYYTTFQPGSLEACKALCVSQYGCKGVEYRNDGACEVWTRPGGIQANSPVAGSSCFLYEPFVSGDGGKDRACRGASESDYWPSYYRLYDATAAPSLDACKLLCMGASDCKGVKYSRERCEVWTRRGGIGATAPEGGSVCLRYGQHDPLEEASAFVPAEAGNDRACRGASDSDDSPTYYTFIGPAKAASLELCMGFCVATPTCQGVDFSSEGCKVWTRLGGVGATVGMSGHTCLRYEPFALADGGANRSCRGANPADDLSSYYTMLPLAEAGTLQDCQSFCAATPGCKGLEFSSQGCRVWTRMQGIGATAPASGHQCLRYEPFTAAGGGKDRACRGTNPTDESTSYYEFHGPTTAASLDTCKALCIGRSSCRGIEYNSGGCKVWTQQIGATALAAGSLCMRYGPPDPAETADAFIPVDGAVGRACRGATASDNSPGYFTAYEPAAAASLDECKDLCIGTIGCRGVEYSAGRCEVWKRPAGIGATVAAPGHWCFSYDPFTLIDGFRDRACRGSDDMDNSASYYTLHSVGSLEECKALCVGTPECKAVEFRSSGRCEVWTRPGGVQATVPAIGYQCLLYEPFAGADAAKDRGCRGASSTDHWPSYYTLYGEDSAPSLEACKALCVGAHACKGLQYSTGRCEIWTRRGGIGLTVASGGSVCLRYGQHDPLDTASAFTAVDRGTDRACRGSSAADISASYYELIGPAKATSLEVCMALCIATPGCQGVEYSSQGCGIWTRPGGIQATTEMRGHACLRYEPFAPADGGSDRACRGATSNDNAADYYTVAPSVQAGSLEACQATCASTPGCKGIEYSPGHCELWTREGGIGATTRAPGYTCLRYEPFTLIDGGKDRSCRGGSSLDNSSSHYIFYGLAQASSLEACKSLCVGTPGCKGLEFNRSGCAVWTRPAGISGTAVATGSVCLRYGAAVAGIEESWPRVGQIRSLVHPDKCLDVLGGATHNGNNLQLADCKVGSAGQKFRMAGDGTGHIEWVGHSKCVDVSAGQNVSGTNVQLWDCEDPPNQNMQFLLPGSGVGQIRWAANPDKCLEISENNVQIWPCEDSARRPADFVLPAGSSFQLRSTKYVTHYMPWFLGSSVDAACAQQPATCSYRDDHWCSSYGNSFYASAKGAYDLTKQSVVDQQLDEMKDAGLDGLWIDYQSANWDGVTDTLIAGARARGMGFAIVVDDTINPNIMEISKTELARWVHEPHYFRHQGFPIIPVFNSESTVFATLPFTAIYISRAEVAKPAWAADTYTWVHGDDGFLSNYYRQEHQAFVSGSAYRGFRDCYLGKTLGFPHIGMLGPSLQLAGERKPAFVQLNTWNDYTEGTMLEPSWLREEEACVDVCGPVYAGQPCLTTAVCGSHDAFTDCSKPVGRAFGPGSPGCGAAAVGNLSARADLDQVKRHIGAERAAEAILARLR